MPTHMELALRGAFKPSDYDGGDMLDSVWTKKGPEMLPALSLASRGILMISGCRHRRSGFSSLRHLPVVLDEIKLFSVSVAGVEVVLQHLRVDLVIVPMIVIETI